MKIFKLNKLAIDDLLKLYHQQFGEESWSKKQVEDAFNNNAVTFYGIYENSTLVCFASVLESLDDINLLDIATEENYKQKGYASSMLKFLLSLKKPSQTFSLEVKNTNLTAINLYNKFGFKALYIRKKYYKNGEDALCMFIEKE